MHLLIGEFAQESNSFAPIATGLEAFRERELLYGEAIRRSHRGKRTVLGGFLQVAEEEGHDVSPIIAASALPSGPITTEAYRHVLETLLEACRVETRPDVVLLSLHGAMVIEEVSGIDDAEGSVVAAMRRELGPDVVIAVVMDLHSDTTDLLLDNADLTFAYNEEPHRDAYERGIEAARLAVRVRRGELRPTAVRDHPPLLFTGTNMATDSGPMRELHDIRERLERQPGVIDISIHGGFFASDQREAGFSVVCTTDGDKALAARLARIMATEAWTRRQAFLPHMVALDEAVRDALAADGTVVLVDEADDPAAGAPCDSVALVRAMLAAGVDGGAVTTVSDRETTLRMAEAGEGAEIAVRLGEKADRTRGQPLETAGRVVRIHRGPIPADMWSGRSYDVGAVGVLDISGVLVVVTEQKVVTENIDILEPLGFDMRELKVVGCKGLGLHIRQALAGKAQRFVQVDAEGVTHRDVRKMGPYRHIRRPVWPLDELTDDAYPPADARLEDDWETV